MEVFGRHFNESNQMVNKYILLTKMYNPKNISHTCAFCLKGRSINMARKTVEKNISYDDVRKKYYVNLDYGIVDGKRIKKTEIFERKNDAKKRLTEFQHQKNNHNLIVPKEDTLGEWLDYWLEDVVKMKNETTTYESYKNIVAYIKADIGGIPLQKLTPKRIQQYYNDKMNGTTGKKLSSNTVKKHHTLLKTALKLAVKQDIIGKNPIDQVETPKYVKPDISYYTAEDVRNLFKAVENDMLLKPAVYLAALLGLRREEICGLKWSNVDFKERKIHIVEARTIARSEVVEKNTKTEASYRTLYIDDFLYKKLLDIKQQQEENQITLGDKYDRTDYVAVNNFGKPINPGYLSSRFRKFIQTNQLLHITLHGLRHSVASIANEAGATMFNISKMLGHSSPDVMGKVYTHLFDDTHENTISIVAAKIEQK